MKKNYVIGIIAAAVVIIASVLLISCTSPARPPR